MESLEFEGTLSNTTVEESNNRCLFTVGNPFSYTLLDLKEKTEGKEVNQVLQDIAVLTSLVVSRTCSLEDTMSYALFLGAVKQKQNE